MEQRKHSARRKAVAELIGAATTRGLSSQAAPAGQRGRANLLVDELAVRLVGSIVQSIAEMMPDEKGTLEKEAWLWRLLAINCEANANFTEGLAKRSRQDFCNESRPN